VVVMRQISLVKGRICGLVPCVWLQMNVLYHYNQLNSAPKGSGSNKGHCTVWMEGLISRESRDRFVAWNRRIKGSEFSKSWQEPYFHMYFTNIIMYTIISMRLLSLATPL
jgi:hypothetical protein